MAEEVSCASSASCCRLRQHLYSDRLDVRLGLLCPLLHVMKPLLISDMFRQTLRACHAGPSWHVPTAFNSADTGSGCMMF